MSKEKGEKEIKPRKPRARRTSKKEAIPSPDLRYYDKLTDAGLQTRAAVSEAIERYPADVMLLSGGLDSSMLAALDPIPAITVQIENRGTDLPHAQQTAEFLDIPWYPIVISEGEAIASLPELVAIHNSFDLAILNDIAVLQGIKYARSLGFSKICTGDGADMAFCGYQYLWNPNRKEQLQKEYPFMKPASRKIGDKYEMGVGAPFLDPQVIDLVLSFDDDVLYSSFPSATKTGDAMVEKALGLTDEQLRLEYGDTMSNYLQRTLSQTQHMWGKLALRFAAKGMLPENIVWRQKTDLQFGSGADNIQEKLAAQITDEEFEAFKVEGYILYNKAHGALLKMFKEQGLKPPTPKDREFACKGCTGAVKNERNHCPTCGVYPAR